MGPGAVRGLRVLLVSAIAGGLLGFVQPASSAAQEGRVQVTVDGSAIPARGYSGGVTDRAGQISPLVIEAIVKDFVRSKQGPVGQIAAEKGERHRYTVTIKALGKDGSSVKTHVYRDCILTGLDFAPVDARSEDILVEKATFKPETLEVQ